MSFSSRTVIAGGPKGKVAEASDVTVARICAVFLKGHIFHVDSSRPTVVYLKTAIK